jgi:predicted nucleotidyltransferase
MSSLGEALFTKTQKKVLGLLYAQPDKSFYTKEILRLTGMGVATIKRELDRMVATGILTLTKIGNQHHYQANAACPIYHELLGIVKKTFGIMDVLKDALAPLEHVDHAFVYGSIAKSSEHASSDIDLMLVGSELSYSAVMELLGSAEQQLGRTINPTLYSLKEFTERCDNNQNFIKRVMEHSKLWIVGELVPIKE